MEVFILGGSAALLAKLRFNFSYQMATKKFICLVRAFCLYLIIDICLEVVLFTGFAKSVIGIHLLTICEFVLFGMIPYLWFLYAEEVLDTMHFISNIILKLYALVMAIYCCLVVTSFKTGYIYSLDHNLSIVSGEYTRILIQLLLFIFLGTVMFYGFLNMLESKSRILVMNSVKLIGFVVPIIFTVYIYYRYNLTNLVPLAVFIAILLSFLSLEDPMNYLDELTGLFNRKKLIALYQERKISYLRDRLNNLYYIDVNDFKEINDTFGHLEGDRVLKIIGKAFKNIDNKYNSVSIRLGGDEFVILICIDNLKGLDFKKIIRDEISKVALEEGCEYEIMTSIGSAILYGDEDNSLEICLKVADTDMYNDKCAVKQKN